VAHVATFGGSSRRKTAYIRPNLPYLGHVLEELVATLQEQNGCVHWLEQDSTAPRKGEGCVRLYDTPNAFVAEPELASVGHNDANSRKPLARLGLPDFGHFRYKPDAFW
jgi:hypothetical protein